jgi:hypothetical protein
MANARHKQWAYIVTDYNRPLRETAIFPLSAPGKCYMILIFKPKLGEPIAAIVSMKGLKLLQDLEDRIDVEDDILLILIIKIGHRKDIYRSLT